MPLSYDADSVTYTIRNDQPEVFEPRQLTVEIRTSYARQATFLAQFPAQEEIILQPDQQYTYRATRRFHTLGEYIIEPFYRNEHYWRPIWPYAVVQVDVEGEWANSHPTADVQRNGSGNPGCGTTASNVISSEPFQLELKEYLER